MPMMIIPARTAIVMIRASKFTKAYKEKNIAIHKYTYIFFNVFLQKGFLLRTSMKHFCTFALQSQQV